MAKKKVYTIEEQKENLDKDLREINNLIYVGLKRMYTFYNSGGRKNHDVDEEIVAYKMSVIKRRLASIEARVKFNRDDKRTREAYSSVFKIIQRLCDCAISMENYLECKKLLRQMFYNEVMRLGLMEAVEISLHDDLIHDFWFGDRNYNLDENVINKIKDAYYSVAIEPKTVVDEAYELSLKEYLEKCEKMQEELDNNKRTKMADKGITSEVDYSIMTNLEKINKLREEEERRKITKEKQLEHDLEIVRAAADRNGRSSNGTTEFSLRNINFVPGGKKS